ncbi:hypothetical protein GCM10010232_38600 [Streptomyces amakusaensis]
MFRTEVFRERFPEYLPGWSGDDADRSAPSESCDVFTRYEPLFAPVIPGGPARPLGGTRSGLPVPPP